MVEVKLKGVSCDLYASCISSMGSLWVAFSLRGGIFSTIFSFILWVILGYNIFDIVVYPGGGVFSLLEPFFVGNIDHLVLFGHA
ncbi:flagellar biosynthesis protein FlgG [Helicobacter pylori]|uniref:flagellar biosynthesis protein FlgG n=1 Tax=Helicobacter pylori TaxID=210 RepID=UPI00165C7C4E|nr:flagellar biosynthesis protein FlgG [Helicobacter pylori]